MNLEIFFSCCLMSAMTLNMFVLRKYRFFFTLPQFSLFSLNFGLNVSKKQA